MAIIHKLYLLVLPAREVSYHVGDGVYDYVDVMNDVHFLQLSAIQCRYVQNTSAISTPVAFNFLQVAIKRNVITCTILLIECVDNEFIPT